MSRAHGRFRAPSALRRADRSRCSRLPRRRSGRTRSIAPRPQSLAWLPPRRSTSRTGSPASTTTRISTRPSASGTSWTRGGSCGSGRTEDFTLHAVSFPYARPEVALFIERLGQQYRAGVRRAARGDEPDPSHHAAAAQRLGSFRAPDGDGHRPEVQRDRRCRAWLEDVLLGLERQGVLNATLERYPPTITSRSSRSSTWRTSTTW
jgi:hypothetical protein